MDTITFTFEDVLALHTILPKEAADKPRIKENPNPTCNGLRTRLYGRDEKLAAVRRDSDAYRCRCDYCTGRYSRAAAKAEAQMYIDEAMAAEVDIAEPVSLSELCQEEYKAQQIYEQYGNALENGKEWAESMIHARFPTEYALLLPNDAFDSFVDDCEQAIEAARLILRL